MSFIGRIVRTIILATGVLLIVVGIPVAPMPIPFGVPMIVTGFLLIASVSPAFRGWIRRRRERNPTLDARVAGVRDRTPGFLRKLIDLTQPGNGD